MTASDNRRFSTTGRVREFSNRQGWGVLDSTDNAVQGGIWFHFSALDMDGYKAVETGQLCEAEVEHAEQDGYHLRALRIRPIS